MGPGRAGDPFLIGENMTGGYGKGADILHDCTIAVEGGQIAVVEGIPGPGVLAIVVRVELFGGGEGREPAALAGLLGRRKGGAADGEEGC